MALALQPKIPEHQQFVIDVSAYIKASDMKVYNDRVAIMRDPEDEMTKGGLYIPEEGKKKHLRGTIVGVGKGVDPDLGYAVGDMVMFTKYNPILFSITLPDGRDANLELMHSSDLYIGWSMT